MARLLVGNDFNEDLRDDRGWAEWWVQRLAWFAEDNDILVLPAAPEPSFLTYVTSMTGVRPESLRMVVPTQADHGHGLLTADRLTDPRFLGELKSATGDTNVTAILSLWPDAAVSVMARAVGLAHVLPGEAFISQGGGALVNSKAVFRAVAAGAGVPIPAGAVCSSQHVAESEILALFERGLFAIIKQDYLSGGRGNEILSPGESVRPVGARRTVVLTDRAAVRNHLVGSWDSLTDRGRHRVVVEEYHRDSSAYYGEYLITDDGVGLGAHGELFSAPYAVAQAIPATGLDPEVLDTLLYEGQRLCESLRTMGYRGYLSADAVVTPGGDVYFTEWNGRVTGSTHLYRCLGERVVGDYLADRVLFDRSWPAGWSARSFADALTRLDAAGLAYDRRTGLGVLFSSAFNDDFKSVMHCVVAESLEAAWETDRRLEAVFGPAGDR